MSKKRRSPKKLTRHEAPPASGESRAIESLTVFWSLCIFSTLLMVVLVVVLRGIAAAGQWEEGPYNAMTGFSTLLLFASIISGSIGGLLTPIMQSRRKRRAPKSLILAAVAIALSPWFLLAFVVGRI
ncbi:hypothetical protein AB1L30_04255 [Bremerella sp. JC817]|uniref:hypothetical protein n=1 Tax=Bremerella sp. JC817 TaxID=3231756 RepID=UPI00345863B8